MDRSRVEGIVREMYAARMRGDVDGIMAHCHDGVKFSIAGSSAVSAVPTDVSGTEAVRETLARLIGAFDFSEADILTVIADGEEAAVHWTVKVRSVASGEDAVTELVDLVRFQGDKVVSYRQFADTALASRLLGP